MSALLDRQGHLDVLVGSPNDRIRSRHVTCHVWSEMPPRPATIELAPGILASSPELAFAQMAETLTDAQLLVLGMELCGSFACDPLDPVHSPARYGLPPLTSQGRMLWFLSHARGLRGRERARRVAALVAPNAWSPREAMLAALLLPPAQEGGFPLAPLTLNVRVFQAGAPMTRPSRVPDILLEGTGVGLNYDGHDHLALASLESAAVAVACDPGSAERQHVVQRLRAQIRERYVDDRRRDRDLASQGLAILPVTAEDLRGPAGLELLLCQLVSCAERGARRRDGRARTLLEDPTLQAVRARVLEELKR